MRHVILNNIAFGLRVWHHGLDRDALRRLLDGPLTIEVVVDEEVPGELRDVLEG